MNEMLARVVRVIVATDHTYEGMLTKDDAANIATAVVASMRVPTPAMMAAGAKKVKGGTPGDCAAAAWRAMIDEILRPPAEQPSAGESGERPSS